MSSKKRARSADDSEDETVETCRSSQSNKPQIAPASTENTVGSSARATTSWDSLNGRMNDVYLGRGKPFQDAPGNRRMHSIVSKHKAIYAALPRDQKRLYVEVVLDEVLQDDTRFMRRAGVGAEPERWEEVDRSSAAKKVWHALRGKNRGTVDNERGKDSSTHGSSDEGNSTFNTSMQQEMQPQIQPSHIPVIHGYALQILNELQQASNVVQQLVNVTQIATENSSSTVPAYRDVNLHLNPTAQSILPFQTLSILQSLVHTTDRTTRSSHLPNESRILTRSSTDPQNITTGITGPEQSNLFESLLSLINLSSSTQEASTLLQQSNPSQVDSGFSSSSRDLEPTREQQQEQQQPSREFLERTGIAQMHQTLSSIMGPSRFVHPATSILGSQIQTSQLTQQQEPNSTSSGQHSNGETQEENSSESSSKSSKDNKN